MAQVGQRPTLDIQAPDGGSVISLLLAAFQVVLNFPPNQMASSQPGEGGLRGIPLAQQGPSHCHVLGLCKWTQAHWQPVPQRPCTRGLLPQEPDELEIQVLDSPSFLQLSPAPLPSGSSKNVCPA